MTNPPAARQILHEVFGYPEFRGRQERIVNTLASGNIFGDLAHFIGMCAAVHTSRSHAGGMQAGYLIVH